MSHFRHSNLFVLFHFNFFHFIEIIVELHMKRKNKKQNQIIPFENKINENKKNSDGLPGE